MHKEAHTMEPDLRAVDVICQHSRDGTIFPIKIRTVDEDGEYQTYTIKGYRDLSHQGTREMPDGVYVTNDTLIFECFIAVFGRRRLVRLYYNPSGIVWKMTSGL